MSGGAVCFLLLPSDEPEEARASVPAPILAGLPGWDVHLLDCSAAGNGREDVAGATTHRLADLVPAGAAELKRYGGDDPALVLGELILDAFAALHAEHRFSLVQVPQCRPAMRLVQAARYGAIGAAPVIAVELGSPSFWRRRHGLIGSGGPRDLKLDHCERYAFAHADLPIATDPEVLAAAREAEWEIGADVRTGPPDEAWYASASRLPTRAAGSAPASVTVVVTHYNHDRYLPGALASLAAQTRPIEQVIVIDDGSTSEAARRVFAEQEAAYPAWTFLTQENRGPGRARNAGLERTDSAYFLPFDSDNLAAPRMIERLVGAMELGTSPAALACHNLSFVEDADVAAGRFVGRYSPTGGPRILSGVENVYGDTSSVFRTETLRAVGGFEVDTWSPTEDWETFVKLVVAGHEVDVLPLPLFYYRTDSGGRLQTAAEDASIDRRLRAHLIDRFLLDASLSRLELRQLFESLQAYDYFVAVETESRLAEQRRWHDSEMATLDRFRETEMRRQAAGLGEKIDAERARADALSKELDALRQAEPRLWLSAARSRIARLGRGWR